jgi:hypothetical protein
MAVGTAEIETASASPIVELAVVETPRRAAKSDLGFLDAVEDRVELAVADMDSQVVAFELVVVVEQQRQALVDPHRREVAGTFAFEPENICKEFGRRGLVARRHDRVVERDGHGRSLIVARIER